MCKSSKRRASLPIHWLIGSLAGLCTLGAGAGPIDLPAQIGGPYAVPATSLREAKFSTMVRQQYDFSCGSAALSTLLTFHYKFKVSEEQVFQAMFAHGDPDKIRKEGFSMLDMKRYLGSHGFEADGFEAPLEKLSEAAIPAIVLINDQGYNHFVVIKGIRDGRVLVGDPSGGTRALTKAAFQAIWVNNILFVITNRTDLAGFNQAADWRVAVRAPLGHGVDRSGLGGVVIPKFGAADF